MPTSVVKSFAKKSGKSVEEIEKMWNSVKKSLLKDMDEKDPKFYPKLVGILKKNLDIDESCEESLHTAFLTKRLM